MKKLLFLAIATVCLQAKGQIKFDTTGMDARLKGHLEVLCSDSLEGRKMGTKGALKAALYIEKVFKNEGIKPFGKSFIDSVNGSILRNITGFIEGCDSSLKKEVIVVGAHFDHVGTKNGNIFRGANDNASGTAIVIEMAHLIKQINPKRTVVFAAFDGEEHGLLGAKEFCKEWDAKNGNMVAMFNFDMAGSLNLKNELKIEGGGSIIGCDSIAKSIPHQGFETIVKSTSFVWGNMTDSAPFLNSYVPAVCIYTMPKPNIHTLDDLVSGVDFNGMSKITTYAFELIKKIVQLDEIKADMNIVDNFKMLSEKDIEGINELENLFKEIQNLQM